MSHDAAFVLQAPTNASLSALGLSANNAQQYLTVTSDCRRKLWRLGARQEVPVERCNWQMLQGRKAGDYRKRGGYHVRQKFLKKLVLNKFRHRLRFSVCLATQLYLSICMLSVERIGFV